MTLMGLARETASRIHRRCVAPFGRRTLDHMLANGLPTPLAMPIRFLFTNELPEHARRVRERVEGLRNEIASRPDVYGYQYSATPFGVARWPVVEASPAAAGPFVTSRWLAHNASVPDRWGLFLHLCAESYAARTILELGAGVGVSGAYLASSRACRRFVTLEGSEALAAVSRTMLNTSTDRATLIVGPFEDGLTRACAWLAQEHASLDLVYVDGHHDGAATLHYLNGLLPSLASGAVLIIDDISLYSEMWDAWKRLEAMPGVAVAVNVGRFGILEWRGGSAAAARYDLSRYTGWWRVGSSRRKAVKSPVVGKLETEGL